MESFELTVLRQLRTRGIPATYIYLVEADGAPFDLIAADGEAATPYRDQVSTAGLAALASEVDGISVDKAMLLNPGWGADLVADAHAEGLAVFTWTCRPENAFLAPVFRRGGGDAAFGDYSAEWAVIRDAGVDGVFVGHADLGVAFFRSRIG